MTLRHLLSGLGLLLAFGDSLIRADDRVSYAKQVTPILRTYCLGCHSRADAQGELSLQSADDILKGSEHGLIVDPANPAASKLSTVLSSTGDDHMPPGDQPQPSAEELTVLQKWISEGATFDSRAVVMAPLPKISPTTQTVRDPILAMRFSADGSRILVGRNKRVEVRSASDITNVAWTVEVPDGKVLDVQWSPDERRALIATGTPGLSGRALEFAIGETQPLREFAGHGDILYAAAWSPDGRIVATAGYDRRIILHDAATGTKLREMTSHNGAIFDLDFNSDGTLIASASADATIKIWNVATGERFDTLGQPQSEQYAIAFSPDDRFIYGAGGDSRIRQWQLVSRTRPQINPLLIARFAHEGAITGLELSTDGQRLMSVAESGTIKAWDAVTVEELAAGKLPHGTFVSSMSISGDARQALLALSTGDMMPFEIPEAAAPNSAAVSQAQMQTVPPGPAVPLVDVTEMEPNNDVATAQHVVLPSRVTGVVHADVAAAIDLDAFQFDATAGQTVLIEVRAERDKSPLDSIVDVVTTDGKPVLQAQLQAVRDSYFTFRGKDADTSDDFRVFNWQEMELNEFLYADGEVVKLWLYPRGPDSGFKVYPGFGSRETRFNTTPTSHPLQGPAFVVTPFAPSAVLRDTGLPVFQVYAENDDDPMRQWGHDSRLMFVPPQDGSYVVRLRDARRVQGIEHKYQLLIRSPQPDFSVSRGGGDEFSIHPSTGREVSFTTTRLDGYDGPIEVFAENLPAGFSLSDPVLIQDEQRQAFAILIAAADAVQPTDEAVAAVRFKARAVIGGQEVVHDIDGLKSLKIAEKPKIGVAIQTAEQHAAGLTEHTSELTVYAGETVPAVLKVTRLDHGGLVTFGNEDSGRNMPHGVFVDNIGLNGLMLLDGQTEREFFITTAKWVPESSRPFYLKSSIDGITTLPVMLHIRHRNSDAAAGSAE